MHSPRKFVCALLLCLAVVVRLEAAEVIPPKPAGYFNDYAGVVSKSSALQFNEQLAQFERETSDQVVVAVYPKMQTDSSVEDYAQRIAQSWKVGQGDKRNGVVLLVFIADHKASIQVGYGLEGALPDVTAFDIRSRHINPHFRNNDYEGGLREGIDLIEKAIKGEYKGAGRTVQESQTRDNNTASPSCVVLFIGFIIFLIIVGRISQSGRRRGWGYSSFGGPFIGGGGGGGWSSGGGGGGFSGFSGGGGSFGGGGSSGSW